MKLSDYINTARGTMSVLSAAIGAHSPDMSRWASGARPIPPERCPAIERATDGRVTCEELRQDVHWQRVPDPTWPHPDGRPCIDVARPTTTTATQQGVCDAA
jgi:DNA-binding transcriptional regulator YdaS (Cro superfamily)